MRASLFRFFLKALFTLLFGTGSAIILRSPMSVPGTYEFGIGIFVGICAVIAFYVLAKEALAMKYRQTNMIVITDQAVIKSWQTSLEEYPFGVINKLGMVYETGRNRPPESSLHFVDARSQKDVELARNTTFGPVQAIYSYLSDRIKSARSNYS